MTRSAIVIVAILALLLGLGAALMLLFGCPEPKPLEELQGNSHATDKTVAEVVAEVDRLHLEQEGKVDEDRLPLLREELTLLGGALRSHPDDYELLWRAARACAGLSQLVPEKDYDYAYQGREFAEAAIAGDGEPVVAHYYRAVCLGLEMQARNLTALGKIEELIASAKEAAKRDAAYDNAGPHRMLARIYWEAPSVLGPGDDDEAYRQIERAIRAAPEWPENYLVKGRIAADLGRTDEARAAFLKVKELPLPEADPRQGRKWRGEANRALRDLD